MEKIDFENMVEDWLADHAGDEEFKNDPLKVGKPELDSDEKWFCRAEDSKAVYSLTDDGTGNIRLDYAGTK